jgi:hypothetical protein
MPQPAPPNHPTLRRTLTGFLVLAGIILISLFIWPTPYRYEQLAVGSGVYAARIHRISGQMQMLRSGGWELLEGGNGTLSTLQEIPAEALDALDGWPRIEWGSLHYDITNGSTWTIWELTVVLTVKNERGGVAAQREYRLQNSTSSVRCGPGAAATFLTRLDLHLQDGQTWTAHVASARGTR